MSDDNGDGIYDVTVELGAGQIEYKFTVDGWTAQEEFAGGESCTLTTGPFTNRVYEVSEDLMLDVVCWNSCDACPQDVEGCIDEGACNYDPEATVHAFVSVGGGQLSVELTAGSYPGELEWLLNGVDYDAVLWHHRPRARHVHHCGSDSWGDGWNGCDHDAKNSDLKHGVLSCGRRL